MQEKIILYSSVLTSMGINLGFPKNLAESKEDLFNHLQNFWVQ